MPINADHIFYSGRFPRPGIKHIVTARRVVYFLRRENIPVKKLANPHESLWKIDELFGNICGISWTFKNRHLFLAHFHPAVSKLVSYQHEDSPRISTLKRSSVELLMKAEIMLKTRDLLWPTQGQKSGSTTSITCLTYQWADSITVITLQNPIICKTTEKIAFFLVQQLMFQCKAYFTVIRGK